MPKGAGSGCGRGQRLENMFSARSAARAGCLLSFNQGRFISQELTLS